MKTVFDSSAFAKRYIEEPGSEKVEELLGETSALGLCVICASEIVSALNRRLREKALTKTDYHRAKMLLSADIGDAIILNLTPKVIKKSIILLEQNILRAMDAFHVACACEWKADLFVTSDYRQAAAARNSNLKVKFIDNEE